MRSSIESAVRFLTDNPEQARYTDSKATAELGDSLRIVVRGSDGEHLETDMPGAVGGRGEMPSPGWLYRAAIASCVASTIGMEAARAELVLESLAVEVDSESDDRGILGMDEGVPSGPLSVRVRVQATARDGEKSRLSDVIERGIGRCPVFDATQREVDVSQEIEVG